MLHLGYPGLRIWGSGLTIATMYTVHQLPQSQTLCCKIWGHLQSSTVRSSVEELLSLIAPFPVVSGSFPSDWLIKFIQIYTNPKVCSQSWLIFAVFLARIPIMKGKSCSFYSKIFISFRGTRGCRTSGWGSQRSPWTPDAADAVAFGPWNPKNLSSKQGSSKVPVWCLCHMSSKHHITVIL